MENSEARSYILRFFGVNSEPVTNPKFQMQFYQDLEVEEGEIVKDIVRGRCCTFYTFSLLRQGLKVK